ncbi:MAG: DUF4835 family protein [Bacteroidota bacterium]|jgi:hypothetical protein|nr:DUF4835 family protein [Bacteroidota bacterium]
MLKCIAGFVAGISLVLALAVPAAAQEIELTTEVTMDILTPSQKDYLADFEQKLKTYVNDHRWCDVEFYGDRIPVRMSINFLSGTDAGEFSAQLVVDAQRRTWKDGRPTQLTSLTFRVMDAKWSFSYIKGTPFVHDEYQYNEITSLIDFYMYVVLGMDFDSYEPLMGTPYYSRALTIAQRSQTSRQAQEWQGQSNQYSRMNLVSELLNAQYEKFREAMYWYFYEGIDFIETDKEMAQKAIAKSIELVGDILARSNARSLLLTMWLESKASDFCKLLEGYAQRPRLMNLMSQVDPARQQIYRQCAF